MSNAPVDRATHEAVDWLLKLENAPAHDKTHHAFECWLKHCPTHQTAWQRVNALMQEPLAGLHQAEQRSPGQLAIASRSLRVQPAPSRRKVLGGGLAMLLLGLGCAGLAHRRTPLGDLLADVHTATGERRSLTLSDGSRLRLNARTAVDLQFNAKQRLVLLREGELQVDVAVEAGRPFIVATRQGQVQAQGTRFTVSQDDQQSLVAVQAHTVLLTTGNVAAQRVEEGQAYAFDGLRSVALAPSLRTRAGWTDGRVDVRDEPLGDLIEALRPYRAGLLRISPAAARIRVYGSFPLDDSDRTLLSLSETLPISVDSFGGWLTRIDVS
ncbi:FecR domain-containing protein [Pseudomonas sp.]|uniref:FecR domain-containing protein n=1 Tax=Pseudomonas sp. TaxID=306 RepID=UPI002FC810D4